MLINQIALNLNDTELKLWIYDLLFMKLIQKMLHSQSDTYVLELFHHILSHIYSTTLY